ncbi:Ig-like domain-containing protein [Pediococcus pentosaceus]|uniref:Ig-like domain-containing protein n=1 Tax=Pediococcus pentosaceus TaxID=1255 RepID=UPI003168A806
MAEDRSKQTLNIYKGDELVASGEVGQTSVDISLPGGTTATDGEYKGTFKDAEGNESVKADFPGFEVPDDTVAVTGVTMSQKTASMKVGDTKTITATIAPENATNKEITTTSDNEKVATFGSDGKITAIGAGTANVTVTTKDGGFTDSCAVTVAEPTVSVTGVIIDPKTVSIEVGKTTKLNSTTAPNNATNQAVTYASSDEKIATVAEDGTVTAVAEGSADITVTTADGGFNDSCVVTVGPTA